MRLDVRDRKILYMLDSDASTPFAAIGKQLHISKEGVAYRVKQLEKNGLLTNFITLTHFARQNMIHFKLYIKYDKISQKERAEIVTYLSALKSVGWLASTEGIFDLMISIRFRTIYEFEDFKDSFCKKYDRHFQSIQIAILTEAETKPRAYLLEDKKTDHRLFLHCDDQKPVELDEVDQKILEAIALDARSSAAKIAEKTKLSQRVVRYRRKELEKKGVIVGYKLAIDYRALGYIFFKCFVNLRQLQSPEYSKLRQYVRDHPNIIYWIKTVGSWDVELEIEVTSIEEFYKIVSDIKQVFSSIIQRIDTSLVAKEHVIMHA